MNGPAIRDALRVILSHAETTVEAGLAELDPDERRRLLRAAQAVDGRLAPRYGSGAGGVNTNRKKSR